LEPLRKGFITKMEYLDEFYLILESELVEHAPHRIFFYGSKNCTQNTKDYTLTNTAKGPIVIIVEAIQCKVD
jgi:hypothetical protein